MIEYECVIEETASLQDMVQTLLAGKEESKSAKEKISELENLLLSQTNQNNHRIGNH